jgi:hypothetical protein
MGFLSGFAGSPAGLMRMRVSGETALFRVQGLWQAGNSSRVNPLDRFERVEGNNYKSDNYATPHPVYPGNCKSVEFWEHQPTGTAIR